MKKWTKLPPPPGGVRANEGSSEGVVKAKGPGRVRTGLRSLTAYLPCSCSFVCSGKGSVSVQPPWYLAFSSGPLIA